MRAFYNPGDDTVYVHLQRVAPREMAEGYKTENGKLFEVYLSISSPLNPDKLTITKRELKNFIESFDIDGDYVANYASDSSGYPGKAWRMKAIQETVNMIYDSSDNNADLLGEIYSSFGGGNALLEFKRIAGYDGFIQKDSDGRTVFVVFDPAQIKSATDNIGTYDKNNPDIRYSLYDYSQEEIDDMIKVLRRSAGIVVNEKKIPEMFQKLKAAGFPIVNEKDVAILAKNAAQANMVASKMRQRQIKEDFLYNSEPFYRYLLDFTTADGRVIVPGMRYKGESFSGDFIAKEYRKYSGKTKGSEKMKQNRAEKLAKASGIRSDELAQNIANKTGEDFLTVEDNLIDYFRDLKKSDLDKKYQDWTASIAFANKEQERQAKLEWEDMEENRIRKEAFALLSDFFYFF